MMKVHWNPFLWGWDGPFCGPLMEPTLWAILHPLTWSPWGRGGTSRAPPSPYMTPGPVFLPSQSPQISSSRQ